MMQLRENFIFRCRRLRGKWLTTFVAQFPIDYVTFGGDGLTDIPKLGAVLVVPVGRPRYVNPLSRFGRQKHLASG